MIQIYGASDDVVVVKGDITEEFTPSPEGELILGFSTGHAPTHSRVEVSDAECVGWLGADAADPDDWQFFYEGDADPDDYEIVRPVYAPVADDSTTNKETP